MVTPNKCVIYVRYSPRPGADECRSAVNQISDLRSLCAREGWPVDESLIFKDEAISGDDWKRPGLWQAIRSLDRGSILLAYSADRLARDSGILAFIVHNVQARGATIHTLEAGPVNPRDPVSKFMFTMLGAFAALQRELYSSRSRNGAARNLAAGKFRGNHIPYGYRWTNQAEGLVEPDPDQQIVIQRAKDLRAKKHKYSAIARELNEAGLTYKEGKPWDRFAVRVVLGGNKAGAKKMQVPKL